jgi:hypothetical protein
MEVCYLHGTFHRESTVLPQVDPFHMFYWTNVFPTWLSSDPELVTDVSAGPSTAAHTCHRHEGNIEWRRITVTSSLNELATDQLA